MGWRHPPPHLRCTQPTQLGELTPQLLEGSLDMAFGNVCLHVNTCVTWIQSLAPSKLYPHRPASLLAKSALCGDGEGRAPRALAGHISGGAGADSWQISLLLAQAPQRGGSGQKAAGQTEGRVGVATGSRRGPRFLGWGREVQWVLGRARLLNSAFANHFLSLFSGAQPPRPPEMTSESFASHCLYLPGPAGTLPRRPPGQRVG